MSLNYHGAILPNVGLTTEEKYVVNSQGSQPVSCLLEGARIDSDLAFSAEHWP